jgi:hypothetical protein
MPTMVRGYVLAVGTEANDGFGLSLLGGIPAGPCGSGCTVGPTH